MNRSPRTITFAFALLAACAPACVPVFTTHGQSARPKTPTRASKPEKPAEKAAGKSGTAVDKTKRAAEAARARRERQQAVALLHEVADAARAVEDAATRMEILLACADALWDADANAARDIFRRAWTAAVKADEAEFKDEQENGRYGDIPERFTRLREQALAATAKRDARLAESFFAELSKWLEARPSSARELLAEEASSAAPQRADIGPAHELQEGGTRLEVALSLLEEGAPKSAAAIAAPNVTHGAKGSFIEFLVRLHAQAPAEADQLYLRLLEQTRADSRADANDALILSTYAVSQRLLVVVDEDGSTRLRALEAAAGVNGIATEVSPSVRAAFFDTAAIILLRSAPPRAMATNDALNGEALARYFAIGRLLPFFERDAARHVPALRERMESLTLEIDATRREAVAAQMRAQKLTSDNKTDPLASFLTNPERMNSDDPKTKKLRQEGLTTAVFAAARQKLWDRARGFANQIESVDARRDAQSIIAIYQVAALAEAYADAEEDDFAHAAQFAREADAPHAVRALGLAHAAELAARRGDAAQAGALLTEALGFAERVEPGSEERFSAFVALASIASRADPARAWELLPLAVMAANSATPPTDEPPATETNESGHGAGARGFRQATLEEVFKPFLLEQVFETMARLDFPRALDEARALKDETTRAFALVACARARVKNVSPAQKSAVR